MGTTWVISPNLASKFWWRPPQLDQSYSRFCMKVLISCPCFTTFETAIWNYLVSFSPWIWLFTSFCTTCFFSSVDMNESLVINTQQNQYFVHDISQLLFNFALLNFPGNEKSRNDLGTKYYTNDPRKIFKDYVFHWNPVTSSSTVCISFNNHIFLVLQEKPILPNVQLSLAFAI